MFALTAYQPCFAAGADDQTFPGYDEVGTDAVTHYIPTLVAGAVGIGLLSFLAYSIFGNREDRETSTPTPTPPVEIGPDDPWQPINSGGLGAQDVLTLASLGNNLYAGTLNNGAFGKDNDDTWTNINGISGRKLGGRVPILYIFNRLLHAGCADFVVTYDSTTKNWTDVGSLFSLSNIETLYSPDDETLYLGKHDLNPTTGAVFSKTKTGNWITVDSINLPVSELIMFNSVLYAGTGSDPL